MCKEFLRCDRKCANSKMLWFWRLRDAGEVVDGKVMGFARFEDAILNTSSKLMSRIFN